MRNHEKGQLMVEFVLGVAVWTALAAGFVSLARLCLMRQRAHAATRLGVLLLSTGRITEEAARAEMAEYLSRLSMPAGATWEVYTGRFLETPASKFYQLMQARVSIGWRDAHLSENVVLQQEEKAL